MSAQYTLTWSAKYDATSKLDKAQRYMEVITALMSSEDVDPDTVRWVACQAAEMINDVSRLIDATPARPTPVE